MKKPEFTIIIVVAFLASGLCLLNGASATTYVNDLPYGFTTWTAVNSPYALTSNLVIESGETLNIQSGVVVHLNGYQIQINGVLNAQGTSDNKVYFSSDGFSNSQIIFRSSSSSSCAVNYAVFYSVALTVEGGAPTISNCYFSGSSSAPVITVKSGSAIITNNLILGQSNQNGVQLNSGYVTLSSNTIAGARYGIYNAGGSITITSNTITNGFTGIYTAGPATIEHNVITYNSNDGIVTQTSDVTIVNNAIAYNQVGISQNANIQNNTISQNTYGLWGQTGLSTIQFNNIVSSTAENVHLTENNTNVDATRNWWGTTVEENIRQKISDHRVHSNLGNLTFIPFLTQPAEALSVPTSIPVPTVPPTPTATSTPTPTPNATIVPITPTPTPTTTPYPYYTPDPWLTPVPTAPVQSFEPIEPTEGPIFGGFSNSDVVTAVVILVAVNLAATIILVIKRKFGQATNNKS